MPWSHSRGLFDVAYRFVVADSAQARRSAQRLDTYLRGRPADDASLDHAAALEAQVAVARRAPEASRLAARLDSLLLDAPDLDDRVVRTTGNVILAGVWERIGDWERMLRVARRRGQAVRVRALRATAEPALQPEVTQARARLAELGTRVW